MKRCQILVFALSFSAAAVAKASDFAEVQALLDVHCVKCHGPEKQKAKIDFSRFTDHQSRLAADDLWERVAIQVEEGDMPPDDEEPLNAEQ
ncbi:MAG: c-type cytochrome domain-containing protein, partial [Verrucomicrobiota bacterium]